MRALSLLTACLCVAGSLVLGAPVIRDYQFRKVNGKPGVIPGYGAVQSSRMALANPNPTNTGAGAGHQYLAVDCNEETYQWMGRTELYHRNDVTPYDDFQGKNSRVEYLAHSSNSGHDGRQGWVDGPVLDVFAPMGRMTHENYWVNASGGPNGPYYEWQPRDSRSGSITSNQFLVYPDSDQLSVEVRTDNPGQPAVALAGMPAAGRYRVESSAGSAVCQSDDLGLVVFSLPPSLEWTGMRIRSA